MKSHFFHIVFAVIACFITFISPCIGDELNPKEDRPPLTKEIYKKWMNEPRFYGDVKSRLTKYQLSDTIRNYTMNEDFPRLKEEVWVDALKTYDDVKKLLTQYQISDTIRDYIMSPDGHFQDICKENIVRQACFCNDYQMLKELKKVNYPILSTFRYTKIYKKVTPLYYAVECGNLECVKFLVECGDDPFADKKSPLIFHALEQKKPELIQYLVGIGCDINGTNRRKKTPLDLALETQDTALVRILFDLGAELKINHEDYNHPLFRECESQDEQQKSAYREIIKMCIEQGLDVNTKKRYGKNLLTIAVQNNDTQLVLYLIEKGANVNQTNSYNYVGDGPLFSAIEARNIPMIQLLLDNGAQWETREVPYDIEVPPGAIAPKYVICPLAEALQTNNLEIGKIFIDRGANPHEFINGEPLIMSILNPQNDTAIRFVLSTYDVGFALIPGNEKILLFAIRSGSMELIQDLVQKGADPFADLTEYHYTRNGLTPFKISPIFLACQSGNIEKIKMYLDKGFKIDEPEKDGFLPYHGALKNPSLEVLQFLQSQGANFRINSPRGSSLLQAIVNYRNYAERDSIVHFLLDAGCDPNERYHNNATLLELAVSRNYAKTCEYLIDAGVDMYAENDEGKTPLSIAIEHRHDKCVELLLEKGIDLSRQNSANVSGYDLLENAPRDIKKVYENYKAKKK